MEMIKKLKDESLLLYNNTTRLKTALSNFYEYRSLDENNAAVDIAINRVIDSFYQVEKLLMYTEEDYIDFLDEEIDILNSSVENKDNPKLINLKYNIIGKSLRNYWKNLGFSNLKDIEIDEKGNISITFPCSTNLDSNEKLIEKGFESKSTSYLKYNLIFNESNKKLIEEILGQIIVDYSDLSYKIKAKDEVIFIESFSVNTNTSKLNKDLYLDLNNYESYTNLNIKSKIEDIENTAEFIKNQFSKETPYIGYEVDLKMTYLKSKLLVLFDDLKSENTFKTDNKNLLTDKLDQSIKLNKQLLSISIDSENKIEDLFLNTLSKWWYNLGFVGDISFSSNGSDKLYVSLPTKVQGDREYNFDYLNPDKEHKILLVTNNNKQGLFQIIKNKYPLAKFINIKTSIDINDNAIIDKLVFKLDKDTNSL